MNTETGVPYAVLGKSGIRVSRICVGTMTFGNPVGEADACRLVSYALDRGVNFFDASNAYEGYDRTFGSSGGISEELLGKALKGRRGQAVVCTKFANPVGRGPLDAGLSARHLDRELHKSLQRLGTDYIDVVLAHRWDASSDAEEVWRVFARWVASGRVLAVGVSNWAAWRVAQASEIARRNGWPPVCVSSPRYNLLDRGIEAEHLACALEYGVALVTYQPFQGGVLTGKYRRGEASPAASRGAEKPGWLDIDEHLFEKLQAIEQLAREACMSMAEYAIAWLMCRPAVAALVVGCRTPEQLNTAVRGGALRFPSEHTARLDAICPPQKLAPGQQVLKWGEDGWCLDDLE